MAPKKTKASKKSKKPKSPKSPKASKSSKYKKSKKEPMDAYQIKVNQINVYSNDYWSTGFIGRNSLEPAITYCMDL